MRLQHHPFSGAGQHRNQERRAPPREQQSGCRAQRHQHDAFGEQLTDQSAAAGANREPDRDLVLPGRRAGEQQVGDIRAADEEHDADDPHHDQQRLGVGRGGARWRLSPAGTSAMPVKPPRFSRGIPTSVR